MKNLQELSLCELIALGTFKYNGHNWRLIEDALGYKLYLDGEVFYTYAARANVAKDIGTDIFSSNPDEL